MAFPQDARFVSLACYGPHGDLQKSFTIQPACWDTKVPIEDAILGLLATHHTYSAHDDGRSAWNMTYRHTTETSLSRHPDFTIRPGGAMVHLGEPIEGTLPITTTSTTITVPGIGTWPRATFSPLPYNALEASNSLANLERTLRPLSTGDAITTLTDPRNPHHAVFLANTLGALSTLEAMPFFPWHQHHFTTHIDSIIGLIGGRIARIHGAYPRTGKDAVHAGEEIAKSTSKAIITAWMVRPNRAYAPRSWVVDEGMGTMMEQLDVLEVQAGINAAQQAFTFVGTPDRFHHLIAGTTSHDTLAYRALLQAIDRALLLTYAADPARLKKVAARHAHLLCDANP